MNVEQLKIPELSLRYLKAAKYVAELRSVTRAGEQLNRSQTAISKAIICLLYTSPSPRDRQKSRMPSSA